MSNAPGNGRLYIGQFVSILVLAAGIAILAVLGNFRHKEDKALVAGVGDPGGS